jgi:hypothetical protein
MQSRGRQGKVSKLEKVYYWLSGGCSWKHSLVLLRGKKTECQQTSSTWGKFASPQDRTRFQKVKRAGKAGQSWPCSSGDSVVAWKWRFYEFKSYFCILHSILIYFSLFKTCFWWYWGLNLGIWTASQMLYCLSPASSPFSFVILVWVLKETSLNIAEGSPSNRYCLWRVV